MVTVTHTAAVFVLGLLTLYASQYFLMEQLYAWLSIVSGVLIVGIGGWLLGSRWKFFRSPELAEAHAHSHSHGPFGHTHSHVHPPAQEREHSHDHGDSHDLSHEHDHPIISTITSTNICTAMGMTRVRATRTATTTATPTRREKGGEVSCLWVSRAV